jgi:hypothetical protein
MCHFGRSKSGRNLGSRAVAHASDGKVGRELECNSLTRDRLRAAGVCDTDKLFEQDAVIVVVPVSEHDREFLVVSIRLVQRVNNERRAQTVGIVSLRIRWT